MKTKTIVSIVFLILLNSCNIDDSYTNKSNIPFYRFDGTDTQKLLTNFEINKKKYYVNQFNDTLKYKVKDSKIFRDAYTTGGTFSGGSVTIEYYYEVQEVELQFLESVSNGYNIIYSISKKPNINNVVTLSNYIDFPFWNAPEFDSSIGISRSIFVDFNTYFQEMNINGIMYNKVRIINSNYTTVLAPNNLYPKKVNRIYHDQNNGIVGFDDLDGKQWRLITE